MWGWLEALVKGILQPFLQALEQYQHGRAAQQRDDAQASKEKAEELADAQARVVIPHVDDDWLHRGGKR